MTRTTRRAALAVIALTSTVISATTLAQSPAVQLFRVVGPRDEVFVGLTPTELARLGDGPATDRLARRLVADGRLTAWQYSVARAPDGSTRFATTRQVSILRNDALRIEPYAPSLPVAAPPAP